MLIVVWAFAAALGCGDDDEASVDAGLPPGDGAIDAALDAGSRDAAAPPFCPTDPWPPAIEALEEGVKSELDARRAAGALCGTTFLRATAALSDDPALDRAARCHAYDMMTRDIVDARGTDGSTAPERAARAGYTGTTTGQAFGFVSPDATAAAIVDGVLSGDATCRSALDPTATDVGVGIAPMDVGMARRYFQITFGH